MNSFELGRSMFIVAHPDDESGGAGVVSQRLEEVMVVFCTDGAPDDPWFWKEFSSREAYAKVRRKEALEALSIAGVKGMSFLSSSDPNSFRDQHLHQVLSMAVDSVDRLVRWYAPDSIITTAYEGGHPDHDSCAFICSTVGAANNVAVFELPLYNRNNNGEVQFQSFLNLTGKELSLRPTRRQHARRLRCSRAFVPNETSRTLS